MLWRREKSLTPTGIRASDRSVRDSRYTDYTPALRANVGAVIYFLRGGSEGGNEPRSAAAARGPVVLCPDGNE
jgi:hypothetical protein